MFRKDKANTCIAICFYVQEHRCASKSVLAKALKRPYSRISDAVDYLYSIKTLDKIKKKGSAIRKPGKKEIYYQLSDRKWLNRLVFNIHSKPLLHKQVQLERIMKEMRDVERETYWLWLKSASSFEWPKGKMEKWLQERPDEVTARCITNSIINAFGYEKIKSREKKVWDWLDYVERELQDTIVGKLNELQLLQKR